MDTEFDNGEALASSPLNETEALMEADEDYLEEEEENDACTETLLGGGGGGGENEQEDNSGRTKSVDSNDGCFSGGSADETSKLLNNSLSGEPHPTSAGDGGGGGGGSNGRRAGSSSSVASAGGNVEPKSPREPFSYAYHFKKKYTFRSDSVYSDVTPMSSAPQNTVVSPKNSESRDKSGSLSSLKGSSSKWVSLKKKLGKINSLSSGKSKPSSSSCSSQQQNSDEPSALQQQAASVAAAHAAATSSAESGGRKPIKSLQERRSLLQRAKTLSILPINSAPKNKEAQQPKKITQPPELFNVGGEMNLIPLEMLIDINDIKRPQ